MGEAAAVREATGAADTDWRAVIAADPASPLHASVTEPRPLKLTIDDLVLLDERWSRQADEHRSTELIDGRIYHPPAPYRPRGWAMTRLMMRLQDAAKARDDGLFAGSRGSVASPPYDLPLPDIVLTYDPHGDGFIPAASVPLVVEVAETALEFFLGEKLRCYARMGIPEYWVVDVRGRVLHRMRAPGPQGYATADEVQLGERVELAAISGMAVETSGLVSAS